MHMPSFRWSRRAPRPVCMYVCICDLCACMYAYAELPMVATRSSTCVHVCMHMRPVCMYVCICRASDGRDALLDLCACMYAYATCVHVCMHMPSFRWSRRAPRPVCMYVCICDLRACMYA